jgi:peroxisomal 3,2-trans-enoyl-CoA isomerase
MSNTDDIETIIKEGNLRIKKFIEGFITFPKILIAFINGPAMGVAVTILALFDAVYASSLATFSLPFIRALAPEGCSSYVFPSLMGSLHAKEILLFDKKFTAEEAQQKGLVTQVIQQTNFQREKEKICQHILSLPKESLLTSKALIQRWSIDTLKYVNTEELNNLNKRWTSEEFAQALLTFINGRKKSKL